MDSRAYPKKSGASTSADTKFVTKWLKDRKGRILSEDDLTHYQKIVVALNETIRIMDGIDEVIDEHGGWPNAFHFFRRNRAMCPS